MITNRKIQRIAEASPKIYGWKAAGCLITKIVDYAVVGFVAASFVKIIFF